MNEVANERYPVKRSRYSSHSVIARTCGAGAGRRLLDVGCARGHLMALMEDSGWRVTGIEPDGADAAVARSAGLEVVSAPAEEAWGLLTAKYDIIVFADVLEHMVDPGAVLSTAVPHLAAGGRIVISIPNVAHLSVRLQLLLGSFTYSDRGILDRTHLRFYTRRTLRELVSSAGLRIVEFTATPAPVEEVFPLLERSRFLRPVLALGAALASARKTLFAYQFIVVAEPV